MTGREQIVAGLEAAGVTLVPPRCPTRGSAG